MQSASAGGVDSLIRSHAMRLKECPDMKPSADASGKGDTRDVLGEDCCGKYDTKYVHTIVHRTI